MTTLPNSPFFEVLHQVLLKDGACLTDMMAASAASQWEGLILKNGDAVYEGKRSKNLLKVKEFSDGEFKITGTYEGEGLFEGTLGGFNIEGIAEWRDKKYSITSDVGSGFKIEQRHELWAKRASLPGQIVTVKYFEVSVNKKGDFSLRFPIFKVLHGTKRDI